MKIVSVLLLIALLLGGCGKETPTEPAPVALDVDLTTLSSTVVYAEVFHMMQAPQDYLGKTVKMQGKFAMYEDPGTGARYFAVIIADATACCSQGLEFVLAGEHRYPEDYPLPGEEVTVSGVFQTYEENGRLYCHLVDAALQRV